MMRTAVFIIALTAALLAPASAFEKLDGEKEKFAGNVRLVYTHTVDYMKRNGRWVETGRQTERDDFSKSDEGEVEPEPDVAGGPVGFAEPEEESPLNEAMRVAGFNAGYSVGDRYGFYKVDEHENILEAVHYGPGDEMISKDIYTYDAEGRELERNSFAPDGTALGKAVSLYDARGNRLEEVTYSAAGVVLRKKVWTYDARDNVTSEMRFEGGKLKYKVTHGYRYDRAGNWVKRTTQGKLSEQGKGLTPFRTITERTIIYQ